MSQWLSVVKHSLSASVAEVAVAAGDRIADHLDEAARSGGRIHQRAVADGEAHQPRLALRSLRLPVELDGVRPGRQAGGERETCPVPAAAVNGACGAPSITALKICAEPVTASCAVSDVPEKRATNPLPDQAKRGWSAIEVVSTRPSQRTPAATTPAGRLRRIVASIEACPEGRRVGRSRRRRSWDRLAQPASAASAAAAAIVRTVVDA